MIAATKFISNWVSHTGNSVTKVLGKSWPDGAPALTKVIKYSKASPLSKMGINMATIENAGKHGKRISLYSNSDCLFSGFTKPQEGLLPIQDVFKKYIKMNKHLVGEQPVQKFNPYSDVLLGTTTTASGIKIEQELCRSPKFKDYLLKHIYYPESSEAGKLGFKSTHIRTLDEGGKYIETWTPRRAPIMGATKTPESTLDLRTQYKDYVGAVKRRILYLKGKINI